ncbi:LacI family DNA-binding transcriptional regulator [Granulicella arctica]|uniref:LacI family DNA-binding transcriptional regulator n=1 Tax=Granulicella arctica TaxID=940613 RepID=UPI0021E0156D|nr:LacI family DNA-binding transcriptional regulator [Granulicella arctica]
MKNDAANAGIKDIANALNVSIGTVDRALHGRPGVSEKTKVKVLAMADKLGYKPNLAAQALKLNRRLSIGVVLPKYIAHFFDPMRAGIRAASAAAVGMQVGLEFYEYARLGSGDIAAMESALGQHHDGVIFVPGDPRQFHSLIQKFARSGTATLCVGSDAPNTDRSGTVAAHAYVSGAIAAELLALTLRDKANVAIFTGERHTFDHAEKLRGFAATLALQAPHLTLLPALENHEKPEEAYRQALALMKQADRPAGLYLSTANSMPVIRALDEVGLLGTVQVITTDLFRELVPLLEYGKVLATLHQRPYTQGKMAFESMLGLLTHPGKKHPAVWLAPHVILRSNLPLFSHLITDTDEE